MLFAVAPLHLKLHSKLEKPVVKNIDVVLGISGRNASFSLFPCTGESIGYTEEKPN